MRSACGTNTSDNASLLSDIARNFSAKLAMEVMLHSALDAASLVCIGQGLSCRAQHISMSGNNSVSGQHRTCTAVERHPHGGESVSNLSLMCLRCLVQCIALPDVRSRAAATSLYFPI